MHYFNANRKFPFCFHTVTLHGEGEPICIETTQVKAYNKIPKDKGEKLTMLVPDG